jgi:hypothetical protein
VLNLTASEHDMGIKLVWDLSETYAPYVAGVEIVWTEDGTTPDFDNIGMRKLYTERNFVILPAAHSTPDTSVQVKAKIRCVDLTGQHCTTPITITPIDTKQYVGDLSALVLDIRATIGNKESLQVAIQDKFLENALGYSSVGAAIQAITRGQVAWGYVRIVAKSGGHFASIQAAINDITELNKYYVIYVMPGKYTEDVSIGNKLIGIVGIGKVLIEGSINCGQGCYLLENIRVMTTVASTYAVLKPSPIVAAQRFFMRDCIVDGSTIGTATYVVRVDTNFVLENCLIKTTVDNDIGLYVSPDGSLTGSINNSRFDCKYYPINLNGTVLVMVKNTIMRSLFGNCITVITPAVVRVYDCIWSTDYGPTGDGTIDYGDNPVTGDPLTAAGTNVANDNINIVIEDDMLSNET